MTDQEKEDRGQRIRDLRADLLADVSDIGDWKFVKYMEYKERGLEPPYTDEEMQDYYAKRQAARDEINSLRAELEEES